SRVFRVVIRSCSRPGRWACGVVPWREPYERRGSSTVLREPRGEIPRGYSPGGGFRKPDGGGAIPERVSGAAREVRPRITSREDETDRVWAVRRSEPEGAWRGKTEDLYLSGFHALLRDAPERWSIHCVARNGEEADGGEAAGNQGRAGPSSARAEGRRR